jgi:hypothetical protein
MDESAGAIRMVYDAKKCSGVLTHDYFVHRRTKYYLCPVHMATAGLLSMGYCLDATGNRVEPRW